MLIAKPMRTQLLELNGEVPFEKGLYHNQAYEKLIRETKNFRATLAFIEKERSKHGEPKEPVHSNLQEMERIHHSAIPRAT